MRLNRLCALVTASGLLAASIPQASSAQLSMTCVGGRMSGGGWTKNEIFNYTLLIKINSDAHEIAVALASDRKWHTWTNINFDKFELAIPDTNFSITIDRYTGIVTGHCDGCVDEHGQWFMRSADFNFECRDGIGQKF